VPKSLKLIVEALLFASDRPLSVKDIHSWLPDAEPANIRSALKVLTYEFEAMGRSFSLKEVAGGYQFRSHSDFAPYVLRMLQAAPARLSRAALETLAIIAYKQPLVRQEIERIRGVESGGILKGLLEKDLIRVVGRKDLPGRPLLYGTTRRFLEVFDLESIDSLPKLKEIKSLVGENHGTEIQAILENAPSPGESSSGEATKSRETENTEDTEAQAAPSSDELEPQDGPEADPGRTGPTDGVHRPSED